MKAKVNASCGFGCSGLPPSWATSQNNLDDLNIPGSDRFSPECAATAYRTRGRNVSCWPKLKRGKLPFQVVMHLWNEGLIAGFALGDLTSSADGLKSAASASFSIYGKLRTCPTLPSLFQPAPGMRDGVLTLPGNPIIVRFMSVDHHTCGAAAIDVHARGLRGGFACLTCCLRR